MAKIFGARVRVRTAAGAAVLFLTGGMLMASPAAAVGHAEQPPSADAGKQPGTNRFVVKFADRAAPSAADRAESYVEAGVPLGAAVTELRQTAAGATVVAVDRTLSAEETADVVRILAANPDVEFVEPDVLLQPAAAAPNDPLYPQQWSLMGTGGGANAAAAWATSTGARQVVAVVDTGITSHTDLQGQLLPGADVISDLEVAGDGDGRDADPQDEGDWYPDGGCGRTVGSPSTWHGTHVSGIIAASTNNGAGISGMAPGARILPVRALGTCGGYMSDISDGIIWAAGGELPGLALNPTPARVINLSLGGVSTCSQSMQDAINYAVSRNAVVVAAAGNDGISADRSQPANCGNVVVVGAADRNGSRANYSNYGPQLDLMAPGGSTFERESDGILSTLNSGASVPGTESYEFYQGTSMAAPHVAGAAALLLAANPALTPAQVEAALKETARTLPGTCKPYCGPKLLDAAAAVSLVAAQAPPFTDVPHGMLFSAEMNWMASAGISTGWVEANGTRTYRPLRPVNRDAMAAFMYRLAGSPDFTPPQVSPFADVSPNNLFYKEITWLAEENISTGWAERNGSRTYRPLQPVNRDAMAAFMYRFAEVRGNQSPAEAPLANDPFTDVAQNNQFYKEISWLASAGISTGWQAGNGTSAFHPLSPVNRDAMAAFMYRFSAKFSA